jgi:4-amino-4-deoxy-L-arabinose transferase-like glycosyltransferase
MQRWLSEASDLILLVLGQSRTPVQRGLLAFFGLIALLGVMKLFTHASRDTDAGWPRRIFAAALFLVVTLASVIATRLYINPHVASIAVRHVVTVAVPVVGVLAFAIPLMAALMRVDYVGAMIGALTGTIACAVVILAVGAITDSVSGGNRSFSKVRKRTDTIDSFIER